MILFVAKPTARNTTQQPLSPVPAAAMAVMTTSITEPTPVDKELSAGTLTTPSATAAAAAIKNMSRRKRPDPQLNV